MSGIEVREYRSSSGERPFRTWLVGLRDRTARARVRARIDRLSLGNFGDTKALGLGLHELRLTFGPGYRIYFGRPATYVVLLLGGGSKDTQLRDIEKARDFWADYRSTM